MTTYNQLSAAAQEIIRKAYDFEIAAIEADSSARNPYADIIKAMGLWEALNDAVEMKYHGA